jgi:hypothetical protein
VFDACELQNWGMDFIATFLRSQPKQADEEHHGASYWSSLDSLNRTKQQAILS